MGLSLLSPLHEQQGRMDELLRKLRASEEARVKAESDLRNERTKNAVVDEGLMELRAILSPLYQGIGKVLGEIRVTGAASDAVAPRTSAVWDSWKEKLSGSAAKAIDTLLLHGEMTAEQLRIHLGCATRTCYNIIGELNKAKLVNKNGGKISLKEL